MITLPFFCQESIGVGIGVETAIDFVGEVNKRRVFANYLTLLRRQSIYGQMQDKLGDELGRYN